MRRELWFGFTIMAIILLATLVFTPWTSLTNGHLGLLMLSLVVVAIMLGFPTAFTLMGMGMIFAFFAYHSQGRSVGEATRLTLDLMVQRTYGVMGNDVLISIPLFVFMGYLVERANLIEKLFKSLHLAMARVPGSLAVATLVTCAVFATATGIVGAVVTLMGLLALPQMLQAGYSIRLAAGAITAGGCLGILIPPSVMLIVYGATAGVSVVQLYAGAFFPGLMLAALYIGYVIIVATLRPADAPPLPVAERGVPLPEHSRRIAQTVGDKVLPGLAAAWLGRVSVPAAARLRESFIALLPLIAVVVVLGLFYQSATRSVAEVATTVEEMGSGLSTVEETKDADGVQEPPKDDAEEAQPLGDAAVEKPAATVQAPQPIAAEPAKPAAEAAAQAAATPALERLPVPTWLWTFGAIALSLVALFYSIFTFARLEIFKMLLGSFFPLAVLILAVLGTIVFGLATPTEAAAVGSLGGLLLAAAYRQLSRAVVKDSVFLTAKTSAMVCWLFVGSAIFSGAFALLGGQDLIEKWVLSMNLTPLQFMLLSQFIIFILGWPLEWTEIIVIFMPIFIPLLSHFQIDPLFFGLLVALNLQTAFLSPPVAMAAFYLKGVAPSHVTLNQIFAGMVPFMLIQLVALALLYVFPQIGLWLPQTLYK